VHLKVEINPSQVTFTRDNLDWQTVPDIDDATYKSVQTAVNITGLLTECKIVTARVNGVKINSLLKDYRKKTVKKLSGRVLVWLSVWSEE